MNYLYKQLSGIMVYSIIVMLTFMVGTTDAQLVTNGSFEDTEVGQVSGTDITGWVIEVASSIDPAPVFEIVDDTVKHGEHSLKVAVNALGSNNWDIQIVADSIPAVPGETYRYTIWAKSENSGARVNLTVGNYDYDEYGAIRPATLTTEWQQYTLQFTVNDNETFIRGPIHFNISGNVGNAIYIDDLRIVNINETQKPITLEAESGEIGNDFMTLEDGDITYVSVQTDLTNTGNPGSLDRIITYEATFPDTGTYNLFTRVRVGPNRYDDDSFFYGNGFGAKAVDSDDDWITVNGLQVAGFSDSSSIVDDPGGLGEGIWKWVNLSKNIYTGEQGIVFSVNEDSLTQVFQIGGREDGLDFDKFAFGRAELYYTVENLDSGEAGSDHLPGTVWEGPPLASNQPKFLGSAYSPNQAPNFEAYWNQVTPENAGKWGDVESTRDVMSWGGLDAAYNFAKDNGFPFTFHVLVWGQQQPGWLTGLTTEEQLAEITEWFHAVADRYPDIDYLQVVNEPLPGHNPAPYKEALGGDGETGWDWVITAFRMAREIFPSSTKLLINEYGILGSPSGTSQYLNIIRLLQAEDLIDAIGVQGHTFTITGASNTALKASLDSLAATGLPTQVTEMDINSSNDDSQLQLYQRIFPLLYSHPGVEGITLWGWKPGTWQADAYLLNSDGTERPALQWLRTYLDTLVLSLDEIVDGTPQKFQLFDNYPNPFNPSTTIKYYLPQQSDVKITIYNIMGMQVRTLVNSYHSAGEYSVVWDGKDNNNSSVSSGVYLYRLEAGSFVEAKKLILMK